jgi:hypothetical protein
VTTKTTTDQALAARVEELERLLGVDEEQRREFVAALELGNEYETETQRFRRLRRVRQGLTASGEPAAGSELAWQVGVVDRAILANATPRDPEPPLAALRLEHLLATQQSQAAWVPSTIPGMPSREAHDERVANARRRLPDIEAQIKHAEQRLAAAYTEA